jgi:hypothetical protein
VDYTDLFKYSKTKEEDKQEKFEKLKLYFISKGYDKTKAFVEASKIAFKPSPLPKLNVESTMTSKSLANSVSFVFATPEEKELIAKFFDANDNDIVSIWKSKKLVEIVRFLLGGESGKI